MGFFDRFKRKHEVVQRAAPKDKAPQKDEQKAQEPETKKGNKASKAPRDYPLYREGGSVLLKPVVSEKSTRCAALGQYVFVVHTRATKGSVKEAITAAYGVRPISVDIQNYQGKKVRFGRHYGYTKSYKKAIVTLPKGKTIDVLATASKT
ncbi:MAG: 50S ribosomal protein L23 [Patescibacteria group bacterium]